MKVSGTKSVEDSERTNVRKSPLLNQTPAQIEAYIDGFTNLDDAKVLLKELARAVRVLAKRV